MKDYILAGFKKCIGVFAGLASAALFTSENFLLFNEKKTNHPLLILVFSSFGATIPVLLLTVVTRHSFLNNTGWLKIVLKTVFCGSCGAISHVVLTSAIFLIGPGNATMLFYTQPIFTLLWSSIFLRNAFKRTDILFVGLAIIAVFLVVSLPVMGFFKNESVSENILKTSFGFILALFSAIFSAAQLVVSRKFTQAGINKSIIVLSYCSQYFIYCSILCTVFQAWEIPQILSAIFMLLSGVALSTGLYATLIALMFEKPATVSVVLTSEVLMNYFGEHFILFVDLNYTIYIASAFIMASCVGMAYTHQQDTATEDEEHENILKDTELHK